MAYKFQNIKTEDLYQKTFLKHVTLNLRFKVADDLKCHKSDLSNYFKSNFAPFEDIDNISDIQPVKFESDDHLLSFIFGASTVTIKVRFPLYKSFSYVKGWLPKIIRYMELRNASGVSSFSIVKFNELQFRLDGNDTVADAMKQLFSQSLFNDSKVDIDKIESEFKTLSRWEKVYEEVDGAPDADLPASRIKITYGYSLKDDPGTGSLILTSGIYTDNTDCRLDDVDACLSKFNHILDQAFHWSVRSEIIDDMKRP